MRIYRQKNGLSVKKLAKKLNLDEGTVRRYDKEGVSREKHVREKMEGEIPEIIL